MIVTEVPEPGGPPVPAQTPIVWRLSLTSSPERVFQLLDTDEGRERFWAGRSRAGTGGFHLTFPGGLQGRVEVVDRHPPTRMAIRYFGSDAVFELTPSEDGGCPFQVTCRCDDLDGWLQFHPSWVSWLLVLKGAADFGIDLRNGSPDRTWEQGYVDQ